MSNRKMYDNERIRDGGFFEGNIYRAQQYLKSVTGINRYESTHVGKDDKFLRNSKQAIENRFSHSVNRSISNTKYMIQLEYDKFNFNLKTYWYKFKYKIISCVLILFGIYL